MNDSIFLIKKNEWNIHTENEAGVFQTHAAKEKVIGGERAMDLAVLVDRVPLQLLLIQESRVGLWTSAERYNLIHNPTFRVNRQQIHKQRAHLELGWNRLLNEDEAASERVEVLDRMLALDRCAQHRQRLGRSHLPRFEQRVELLRARKATLESRATVTQFLYANRALTSSDISRRYSVTNELIAQFRTTRVTRLV